MCDEAQKIKNPSTRLAQSAKAMRGDIRIAITGTPVENSLDDLWSITDFFQPGLLGSLKAFREDHGTSVIEDVALRERAAETLRRTLEPVMLRRMKGDVGLSLPEITERTISCAMSPVQTQLYARVREVRNARQGAALAAITRMLQACAHPALLAPTRLAGVDPSSVCPKLDATMAVLEQVHARGEKALVFARWVNLQKLLADAIAQRFGVQVTVLNGTVPAELRQGIVDAFSRRAGFGVLVLSPRACGVGLNITAANHVIHYTREWNPAVEVQATDRVYRMGQTRPVTVYFPIVEHPAFDTAEVILSRVLDSKEALRADFIQPVEHSKVTLSDFERAGAFSRSGESLRPADLVYADPARLAELLSPPRSGVRVEQEIRVPEGRVFVLSDGTVRLILFGSATPTKWPDGLGKGPREVVATVDVGLMGQATMRLQGLTLLTPTVVCDTLAKNGVAAADLLGFEEGGGGHDASP